MDRWMIAKDLAELLGKHPAWLYYHSRASDGPIQRRWGTAVDKQGRSYNVVEFNSSDAKAWASTYVPGSKRGVLYPSSLLPERLGTPAELMTLVRADQVPRLKDAVAALFAELGVAAARRNLKVMAGGRR
jgi:hypothetical protein